MLPMRRLLHFCESSRSHDGLLASEIGRLCEAIFCALLEFLASTGDRYVVCLLGEVLSLWAGEQSTAEGDVGE